MAVEQCGGAHQEKKAGGFELSMDVPGILLEKNAVSKNLQG
ncbi:MAG: hypothetical protein R6V39_03255 [Desulfovibrionales bacterium]